MKHKTAEEIQADIILAKVRAIDAMTPKQRLEYVRKELKNKNIQLGRAIGFGLALVELMVYWEEDPENIKDFIARHQELIEKYGSSEEEDKEQIHQWFRELYDKTGFNVLSGWIDEDN